MSGVKHTPGPWFEQTGFADDVEITADSRQGMVAICAMDLDFTGHIGVEQEANARLIAAAPDLLEALETLDASWLADFPAGPDGDYSGRFVSPAEEHVVIWRKIRAAIARARGES